MLLEFYVSRMYGSYSHNYIKNEIKYLINISYYTKLMYEQSIACIIVTTRCE